MVELMQMQEFEQQYGFQLWYPKGGYESTLWQLTVKSHPEDYEYIANVTYTVEGTDITDDGIDLICNGIYDPQNNVPDIAVSAMIMAVLEQMAQEIINYTRRIRDLIESGHKFALAFRYIYNGISNYFNDISMAVSNAVDISLSNGIPLWRDVFEEYAESPAGKYPVYTRMNAGLFVDYIKFYRACKRAMQDIKNSVATGEMTGQVLAFAERYGVQIAPVAVSKKESRGWQWLLGLGLLFFTVGLYGITITFKKK